MRVFEIEKLCRSQEGITAAYRAGLYLQEQGWMRFPASSWDKPAILAFDGDRCVAGINFSEDLDDGALNVNFAWCSSPKALALILLRIRQRLRSSACSTLTFTYHEGNAQMARVARLVKAAPHSHTYHLPISSRATQ